MCRERLVELRVSYDQIKNLGAEVLAVSTQKPVNFAQTVKELGFEYPVLYDTVAAVPQQYGVYSEGAAVPSTFLLDKTGVIRWKYVAADEHDLPSMRLIIDQLEALQKG